ncbi:SRPBCC family protein [Saccharothrix luteola]|uniref:SRPBCC family protein n=1 Tax=Saccharothrix luteola TaxID=2893018 RepID=UPI001E5F02C5|nr:SRPBCC family protein [Saccharothrix luteola]MCC8245563.1 SRPBCC family protein [Saccharothrix luteola]
MLSFSETATIEAEPEYLWQVASDLKAWQDWDPHVEKLGFEGRFEVGASGWTKPRGGPRGNFTITSIEDGRSYSTESPMPMGKMLINTIFEPVGEGKVKVTREVELSGAFVPVFKKLFLKGMRADMHETFAALEAEAQRRAAAQA